MRGLDEARVLGAVAERLANLAHRDFQHGVADEHAGPHRVEQFLLRYEPAGTRGQVTENGKCLGSQGDRRVVTVELAAPRIEPELAKAQAGVRTQRAST